MSGWSDLVITNDTAQGPFLPGGTEYITVPTTTGGSMFPGTGGFFDTVSALISGIGNVANTGLKTLTGVNATYQGYVNPNQVQQQQLMTYAIIGAGFLVLVLLLRR